MSRRSIGLQKDSTLSVNIIHCFVLLFSFTAFFMFHSNYIWFSLRYNCGLVTELSLPFPSSCSCSDETETKILVEDSRPVLLHLRVPKCLLTVVISVLEWPIDFYIKVLVQIQTDTKSSGWMVLAHLLHLRNFMSQKILPFDCCVRQELSYLYIKVLILMKQKQRALV